MMKFFFTVVLLNLITAHFLFANNENAVLSPQVHAPADVVVSCSYWFSLGMLYDPDNAAFGRFVYGQSNIQKLKTHDIVCPAWCTYDPTTKYDPSIDTDGKACELATRYYSPAHPYTAYGLIWGWDGYAENWTSTVSITVDDRRECGTGLIIRRFTIEDRGIKYYDDQHIWILDCDPFYVSDDCYDKDDDIEWPLFCQQPEVLNGCNFDLSPDNPLLGRPMIQNAADNHCNLISIDYVDDTITVEENACLKVIRTWSVVDWCRYHPNRGSYEGRWDYVQVIKVRDKYDPEIEVFIGECHPAEADSLSGECFGLIELKATGKDSCTEATQLRFEYKIDLYGDGKGVFGDYDLQVGPLARASEDPQIQENRFAQNSNDVLNASGVYPIGVHRLKWFVEDGCGNVASKDTFFEVKDCKEPTPYCKPGLITVIMPSGLSIGIWAKDLNDSSYDNCTSADQLKFSFSSDTSDHFRMFDCDDLGTHALELWVTDEEGNQDYCVVTVLIQDSGNHCSGNTTVAQFQILEVMTTGANMPMKDVYFRVFEDGRLVDRIQLQNTQFKYDFGRWNGRVEVDVVGVGGYEVSTLVNNDDFFSLYQYLLGEKEWTHYTQYLAADIDQNGSVNSADLSALFRTLNFNTDRWPSTLKKDYVFAPENIKGFVPTGQPMTRMTHEIDFNYPSHVYQFRPVKLGDLVN